MKRYRGEPMAGCRRVAVVSNDALGNYVVATPLIQMIRREIRTQSLHYYGGTRTSELWSSEDLIDFGYPLFGSDPKQAVRAATEATGGEAYDLIVNLEASDWAKGFVATQAGPDTLVVGPCIRADGRGDLAYADDAVGKLASDSQWTASDLPERFPFLRSGFIGEIFCRLTYLEGEVPSYRLPMSTPAIEIPGILISTAGSSVDKLWPRAKWTESLRNLKTMGFTVGLLGAKPSDQRQFWEGDATEADLVAQGLVQDLRGMLTLPEVVGALGKSRLVLTIDNGILHLACATSTPIVGLFRHGIHRLWAPRVDNLSILTAGVGEDVSGISSETVLEAVACAISAS